MGSVGWRETIDWKIRPSLRLRGGIDHQLAIWNADMVINFPGTAPRFPSPQAVDPTREAPWKSSSVDINQGYWAELIIAPRENVTITPGLRLSHLSFGQSERLVLEPRLAGRWEITDKTAVKGASGIYRKLPDPMSGLMLEGFGNPRLDAERSVHLVGGVEHDFGPLSVSAEGFHVWRDNLPSPTDDVRYVDGKVEPVLFDNRGGGRSYGMELLVRRNPAEDRKFSGWIAYTLSRSTRSDRSADGLGLDQFTGIDVTSPRLDDLPPETRKYLSPFDQTHILTTVGRWELPWKMSLGFRFQLVSGNPITPFEKGRTLYDADTDAYQVRPDTVVRNSARLPTFHRLDLRIDKRWDWKEFSLTAYLELMNTYNHRPVESFGYDYRYRSRNDLLGLPILPIVGLKGEF
jgi:outer membrane receptor protein involved in Fe transport